MVNDHFMLDLDDNVSEVAHRLLAEVALDAVDRQPVVANPITDVALMLGDEAWLRDLSAAPQLFSDEDLDPLTYSASTGDTSVALVELDRYTLAVTPVGMGTTLISVKGTDGRKQGRTSFRVTVAATSFSVSLDLDSSLDNQRLAALSGVKEEWSFSLQLHGYGIRNAVGLQASIIYDDTQLTFQSFENPGLFGGMQAEATSNPSAVKIVSDTLAQGTSTLDAPLGILRFQTSSRFSGTTIRLAEARLIRMGGSEAPAEEVTVTLFVEQGDFDGDGIVRFNDFLLFALSYGVDRGEDRYDGRFDLDTDGKIGFADFLLFAKVYGAGSL